RNLIRPRNGSARLRRIGGTPRGVVRRGTGARPVRPHGKDAMMLPSPARSRQLLLGAAVVSLLALLWSYWTTLAEMAQTWSSKPQYSHGFLVPLFAGVLLWLRRDRLQLDDIRLGWWGLPLVAIAVALRLYGTYYHYAYYDAVSFVVCLAGVWLMV